MLIFNNKLHPEMHIVHSNNEPVSAMYLLNHPTTRDNRLKIVYTYSVITCVVAIGIVVYVTYTLFDVLYCQP